MSAAKPEGSGGGLEDADLDSLFMEEPLQRPGPAAPIDYKKRQSGEREDPQDPKAEEQTWPRADLEPEEPAPDLSEEPWPSPIEDAPEDSPIEAMAEPDPGGEVDLDPQHDRRHAVQDLGKATGRSMINGTMDPKPKPPKRIHGEHQPSDRNWREEIAWILQGRR